MSHPPIELQLLDAMRIGLGRLANAGDEFTRARLIAQLNLALGELVGRTTQRAAALRRASEAARLLALRGSALLRPAGAAAQRPRPMAGPAGEVAAQENLESAEMAYAAIKSILVDCVRSLSASHAAHGEDGAWSRAVDAFFEDLTRHEAQVAIELYAQPPAMAPGNRETFDAAKLAAYFAGPRHDRPAMTLVEAKSLSGGFSRQTILATLLDAANNRISLILRKQLDGGLLGSSCLNLAGELLYLDLAHDAGLPVPKVMWYEPDGAVLGADFVVLSRMEGTSLGSSVAASGAVDEGIVRQLAAVLAKLHTIDWSSKAAELCPASGLPVDVNISAADAAAASRLAFELLWRESDLGPLPTLELIADWLKRHVPATERRPMLSHGDVGFHNMMGDGTRLTALLDWETARLADPAKDMAMTRNFITNFVPWDRFYAWYRDAGGPAIDDASLDYYAVYHSFAHLLVCEVALGSRFAQGSTPDLEYLQLGLPVRAHFFRQMLASCTRIWSH